MALCVVTVPLTIKKVDGAACLAPDFGSYDAAVNAGGWGQVSSKLSDERAMCVRVDLPQSDAEKMVAEVGGALLGVAFADAAAEDIKARLSVERPPRFDEAEAKKRATQQSARALWALGANSTDSAIAAAYRAHVADRAALLEVAGSVASFERPVLAEYRAAVDAIVKPLEG